MRTALALLVALGGTARADKLAAPLCVPKNAEPSLYYARGAPVACWGKTGDCVQLGKTDAERLAVSHPQLSTPTPPQLKEVKKKQLMCVGATCKPVGKKLLAALGKLEVSATADVKSVVLVDPAGMFALWDVVKDREVAIKPPKNHAKDAKVAKLQIVDSTLLARWTDCTAPCNDLAVIDGAGAIKSDLYPGGSALAIDDTRIAIVPWHAAGTVTIIAAKTGKQLASVELVTTAVDAIATMLGPSELGVLVAGTLTRISVPAGKPVAKGESQTVPACK